MKIMDLTNEPMIAKTLIGGVLGTPEFKVSIDSTHVRVASKEFWFELRKEADGSTVIASNNIQPVKIKTIIFMLNLLKTPLLALHLLLQQALLLARICYSPL